MFAKATARFLFCCGLGVISDTLVKPNKRTGLLWTTIHGEVTLTM